MRTTIRQVAQQAKVSAMTVSRVLSGQTDNILPETRVRVLKVVRDLNYVPVPSFVQNRSRLSYVAGIVFDHSEAQEHILDEKTFKGLRAGLHARQYDMLIQLRPHPEWALERQEAMFLTKRCDGFIFVNPWDRRALFDTLVRIGVPVVGCYTTDVPESMGSVVPDNAEAMRLAVEHLAARGHRHIAHWAGPEDHSDARQRREGFEAAICKYGLSAAGIFAGEWRASEDISDDLLEQVQRIFASRATAVVCGNDNQALMVWRQAEKFGLRVPEDLSLIGVDDTAEGTACGLTSVHISFQEIGRVAADLLLCLVNGDAELTTHRVVPTTLVERASVAWRSDGE